MAGKSGKKAARSLHRKRWMIANAYLMLRKGERYLPMIVRSLLGLVLVAFGVLGFLPILGFWMIPLGLALVALDIPPLEHWMITRLQRWRCKLRKDQEEVSD